VIITRSEAALIAQTASSTISSVTDPIPATRSRASTRAVRTVTGGALSRAEVLTALPPASSTGAADFKAKLDWKHAVAAGKDAPSRREDGSTEDLHE